MNFLQHSPFARPVPSTNLPIANDDILNQIIDTCLEYQFSRTRDDEISYRRQQLVFLTDLQKKICSIILNEASFHQDLARLTQFPAAAHTSFNPTDKTYVYGRLMQMYQANAQMCNQLFIQLVKNITNLIIEFSGVLSSDSVTLQMDYQNVGRVVNDRLGRFSTLYPNLRR